MKLTIQIDEGLHRRLRVATARKGVTVSEVVRRYLTTFVEEAEGPRALRQEEGGAAPKAVVPAAPERQPSSGLSAFKGPDPKGGK